jgi:hypothetical protein
MTRLRPQVYRGFWMQQLTYGPLNGLAMMFYNMAKEYLPDASKGTGKNGRATTRMARLRQPLPPPLSLAVFLSLTALPTVPDCWPTLSHHFRRNTAAGNLVCSLAGYGLAGAVTNPFDVVKTRIQVAQSNPELFNYQGSHELIRGLDAARQMLAKEGPLAFLAGISGRVGWLAPRCALAVTAFESIAGMIKANF